MFTEHKVYIRFKKNATLSKKHFFEKFLKKNIFKTFKFIKK